jgi:predicted anti-sigma-YlaC factor YlaD
MMLKMRVTKPCPQFSAQMSLALDNQLSTAEERKLLDHLRTCDACRAQWEALQQIERLFTTAPLISPPAGFAARVSARLTRRESRWPIVFGVLSLVVGSFVLGLVTLASVGEFAPSLYSLYLLVTTPAVQQGLTVVIDLLSLAESVLNALRLAIVACIRSPGAMVYLTYNLAVLALTALWLRVLTGRFPRLLPVSRRA